MLSEKVREQAREIQVLQDRLSKAEDNSPCTMASIAPLPPGKESTLARSGPPSFKEHMDILKQLSQVSKEYRAASKKLEEAAATGKQLRRDLEQKEKELTTCNRQLAAAQKSVGEAREEALHARIASASTSRISSSSSSSSHLHLQPHSEPVSALARSVRDLQGRLDAAQEEARAAGRRAEEAEARAAEGSEYIAVLKKALELKGAELGVGGGRKGAVLEELVKARATIAVLSGGRIGPGAEMEPKEAAGRQLEEITRQAEESVALRQLIAQLEGEKGAALDHIEALEEELKGKEEEVEAAQQRVRGLESMAEEQKRVVEEARGLRLQLEQMHEEVARLTEELRLSAEELNQAKAEVQAGEQERRRLEAGSEGVKEELQDSKAVQEELLGAVKEAKAEARRGAERCEEETAALQQRVTQLSQELAASRDKEQELRGALAAAEAEERDRDEAVRSRVEEEGKELVSKLHQAQTTADGVQSQLLRQQTQLEEALSSNQLLTAQVRTLEERVRGVEREKARLERESAELRHALQLSGVEKAEIQTRVQERMEAETRVQVSLADELSVAKASLEDKAVEAARLQGQLAASAERVAALEATTRTLQQALQRASHNLASEVSRTLTGDDTVIAPAPPHSDHVTPHVTGAASRHGRGAVRSLSPPRHSHPPGPSFHTASPSRGPNASPRRRHASPPPQPSPPPQRLSPPRGWLAEASTDSSLASTVTSWPAAHVIAPSPTAAVGSDEQRHVGSNGARNGPKRVGGGGGGGQAKRGWASGGGEATQGGRQEADQDDPLRSRGWPLPNPPPTLSPAAAPGVQQRERGDRSLQRQGPNLSALLPSPPSTPARALPGPSLPQLSADRHSPSPTPSPNATVIGSQLGIGVVAAASNMATVAERLRMIHRTFAERRSQAS